MASTKRQNVLPGSISTEGVAPTTEGDWLLGALDEVEGAAERVREVLAVTPEVLGRARQLRRANAPLAEIALQLLQSGGTARRRATEEFRTFDLAVANLRRGLVRALVDEEGASLTQVADAMGVSRQSVARLYHSQ